MGNQRERTIPCGVPSGVFYPTLLYYPMRKGIHPEYTFVTVRLADGTEFQTRSTMKNDTYVSEVDSTNHPFYTGRRQYVDTAGRVEKFKRRYGHLNKGAKQ